MGSLCWVVGPDDPTQINGFFESDNKSGSLEQVGSLADPNRLVLNRVATNPDRWVLLVGSRPDLDRNNADLKHNSVINTNF
ncbi:UNVERIFIED_CONTAM: hypothetical protein Sradi_1175400 [Sesamum radiatum]|uniref:Uncharacterized protein n=1 Tax=Sesamum radiatum TaxID=300843 RepID=A0AAW2UKR9_SESRA